MLRHRLADALGERADDLAVDQQRVDRVAAVVDRDEAFETNQASVAVDAHERDAGAEAPRRLVLTEEDRRFEARTLARWQAGGAVGEVRDAAPADHLLGRALHAEAACHELEILGSGL